MDLDVLENADAVAREAAAISAGESRTAVAERGRFVIASCGDRTPRSMWSSLSNEEAPSSSLHLAQVDERAAPLQELQRKSGFDPECVVAAAQEERKSVGR